MLITQFYTFFYKDKIAQWNMTNFIDDSNLTYCCAEQYMMAQKALLFEDIESYNKIMNSNSPKEIQELGRKISNFDSEIWDNHKIHIVYKGNYFKFTQNKELFDILFSTRGTTLVEVSPIDKIWGIGLDINNPDIYDSTKWLGENLLGQILTKLRDNLITEKIRKN